MKLLALAVCLLAALPHADSVILGNMFGNLGANICQFCDYCQFVKLCGPPCTRSFCYLCKFKHHCTTTCRFCEKSSPDTFSTTPTSTTTSPSPSPSSVPIPSSSDPTFPPSDSAVPAFDISRFDTSQLSSSLMGVISKLLHRGHGVS